jgi:hypothetical protein
VVNPAPPSGSAARKEAKQRQAATAKSEEGAQEEAQQSGGDLAQGPPLSPGSGMSRRDRVRPGPSITPLARAAQPSAWPRGLLYGGGIGLAALSLALGFTVLRPRPRRRPPVVPAPARAPLRRRPNDQQ